MPNVPTQPEQLPQQRIYLVDSLPLKPEGEIIHLDHEEGHPLVAKRMNPKAKYLCQVEWSWTPINNRITAYYLNRGRQHWVLWASFFDDNVIPWSWSKSPVAFMERRDVTEKQAAVYLLMESWRYEFEQWGLECYHWINEADALSVGEIKNISDSVWDS